MLASAITIGRGSARILSLGIFGLFLTRHTYHLGFWAAGAVAVRHLRHPWTTPSQYEV